VVPTASSSNLLYGLFRAIALFRARSPAACSLSPRLAAIFMLRGDRYSVMLTCYLQSTRLLFAKY
jgi:hypothetical protein